MALFVLATWLVQSAVGVSLLVSWLRHRRPGSSSLVVHVTSAFASLALWTVFVVTGNLVAAWLAFVVITVANTFGDRMLIARARRMHTDADTPFWPMYGRAIADVVRGRTPRRVTFHALFAGVVYFSCLGVCIGATIAA